MPSGRDELWLIEIGFTWPHEVIHHGQSFISFHSSDSNKFCQHPRFINRVSWSNILCLSNFDILQTPQERPFLLPTYNKLGTPRATTFPWPSFRAIKKFALRDRPWPAKILSWEFILSVSLRDVAICWGAWPNGQDLLRRSWGCGMFLYIISATRFFVFD